MTNDAVIQVEHLQKKFCRRLRESMWYGMSDIAKDMAGIRYDSSRLRPHEFLALDDINFELRRGRTLGVIGENGCGKTTLLRLLNGIFPPDKGRIVTRGRIGALIAIGAGFHPSMTGRENIFLNATILGMSRRETLAKLDAIIEFADIGEFLDAPVSTYSSGMKVRLGFAIAIYSRIEILLADEVLAVGDISFRVKCFEKIAELRRDGVSTLMVSHDMSSISSFASEVLLLKHGRVQHYGDVETGIQKYHDDFLSKFAVRGERIERAVDSHPSVKIERVEFFPPMKDGVIELNESDDLRVEIYYDSNQDFDDVEINSTIALPLPIGKPYFDAANIAYGRRLQIRKGKGRAVMTYRKLRINNFKAYYNFNVADRRTGSQFIWWRKIPLLFKGRPFSYGFNHADVEYAIESREAAPLAPQGLPR